MNLEYRAAKAARRERNHAKKLVQRVWRRAERAAKREEARLAAEARLAEQARIAKFQAEFEALLAAQSLNASVELHDANVVEFASTAEVSWNCNLPSHEWTLPWDRYRPQWVMVSGLRGWHGKPVFQVVENFIVREYRSMQCPTAPAVALKKGQLIMRRSKGDAYSLSSFYVSEPYELLDVKAGQTISNTRLKKA
jgi:hypothetical protein